MEGKPKVGKENIAFKGVSLGVYLEISGSNMEAIKEKLDKKVQKSPGFFQGTKFLDIEAEDLSPKQILEIKLILKYKYDFKISLEEIDFSPLDLYPAPEEDDDDHGEEELTLFVYRTVRSGQEIDYNGNIVVIGDVNPGALLKANGNIIVLGCLKGVAHAEIGRAHV